MSDEYDSWSDDVDSSTISCPECSAEIYDDVELCPHCGFYLEDAPSRPLNEMPRWFLVLGLLGVLAVILALSGLM